MNVIEILGYGGVVPAAVSIVLFLLCRRLLPLSGAERYAAAVAVGAAFFAGFALLPWAGLAPQRHWHWLAYLGLATVIVGPVGLATGVHSIERRLLCLLLAIAAACLLVPTWSTLQPSRYVYIALLAAWLFVLMAALDSLPERLLGTNFLAQATLVATATAVLLAAAVSVKFGQLGGIAAAGLGGCVVSRFFASEPIHGRGLIPVYAVLVGGLTFVGSIELQPPVIAIALAPGALVGLAACALGPLSRLSGAKAVAVQTALVLAPLAALFVWVFV